jgi:hypothetical protein
MKKAERPMPSACPPPPPLASPGSPPPPLACPISPPPPPARGGSYQDPGAGDPKSQAGFTPLEELGRDEHGTWYRAEERTGRIVSILVLRQQPPLAGREIVKLEKQLIGLKHPAIVPILKLITDTRSSLVYAVVGEDLAGRTLTEWLSQNGLPNAQAAARLVLTLAEAIQYAGGKKMIHGLLTPETIQIGDDGSPRITGFGLSRLGCGPKLPAPTAQTDADSLRAVLEQLLTGVPQVPADLEAICRKRYAAAGELAADLRQFLGIKPPGLLGRVLGKS